MLLWIVMITPCLLTCRCRYITPVASSVVDTAADIIDAIDYSNGTQQSEAVQGSNEDSGAVEPNATVPYAQQDAVAENDWVKIGTIPSEPSPQDVPQRDDSGEAAPSLANYVWSSVDHVKETSSVAVASLSDSLSRLSTAAAGGGWAQSLSVWWTGNPAVDAFGDAKDGERYHLDTPVEGVALPIPAVELSKDGPVESSDDARSVRAWRVGDSMQSDAIETKDDATQTKTWRVQSRQDNHKDDDNDTEDHSCSDPRPT